MENPAKTLTDSLDAASDLELFRKARGGRWEAFDALVTRLEPKVFRVAWRITGSRHDAEDVTQQTFLSALEHLEDFREASSVQTWVLRIATNAALQLLRKRRGLPTIALDKPADSDSYASVPHPAFVARWKENPEDLAHRNEVKELLAAALSELDEKYRAIFVLRDIEGLSTQETAEALGISVANAKVRLLRARLQLRERLTAEFGDQAQQIFLPFDGPERNL